MMNSNKLLSRIEALLFVAGDEGMTVKQLAQYIDVDIMEPESDPDLSEPVVVSSQYPAGKLQQPAGNMEPESAADMAEPAAALRYPVEQSLQPADISEPE